MLEVPKASPWETVCSISISILCIFRGEKSEYDNEFVGSTTRAVSTRPPHVNTWVPATLMLLIQQISLMSLCWAFLFSKNAAWTVQKALHKHCWHRHGHAQGGDMAGKLTQPVPWCPSQFPWTHTVGLVPQPGLTLILGRSKEGAKTKSEEKRSLAGEQMCRAHGGWLSLSPALWARVTPQLWQELTEPEPETRTFPNPGVLDLPEFWFSWGCLVYVTVHYFRNGCQLSKEAVGKFRLMGNLSVQTKSQSSHKTVQTFSQLCYITHRVWATLDHFTAQLLIFL